ALSSGEARLPVDWIDGTVRVAAARTALAAFYVAWFVYEDEEKKLQNKIETWWVQFDDFRSHLVSRQAAFVAVVALRASEVIDRLFGPKLLGMDAIAEAASVTLGSTFLTGALLSISLDRTLSYFAATSALTAATFACAFAPLAC